jgi:hypothetical protein
VNTEVQELAEKYRHTMISAEHSCPLRELAEKYRHTRENNLLAAVSDVGAAYGLFMADRINMRAVDPQMVEALSLAYPQASLEHFAAMSPSARAGALNGWKGKYFEVLVRDELNAGSAVGDLALLPGQEARLATSITEPGWDLEILNADGGALDVFQLKATNSLGYVRRALDRYPDIQVIATDELGLLAAEVSHSGFSNVDLDARLIEPFASLQDSSLTDFVEEVLPFLPVILIAGGEGRHIIAGRKTVAQALRSGGLRGAKSGAALGVGGLVALIDGGWFSLPATALTRLAIGRYESQARALVTLEMRLAEARSLLR